MSASNSNPELSCLAILEAVVVELKKADTALTHTTLKRTLGFDDNVDPLNEALEHGRSLKILKRDSGNWFTCIKSFVIPEEAYYKTVKSCIENVWKSEKYRDAEFHCEDTSKRDSKIVGRWTRPDLTLVSYKKFSWTVGFEFDVVTFEVKRPDSADVLAVFEALSHASVATRAYVVFPLSESQWQSQNLAQSKRVKDECARHGVGLILIEDPISASPKPIHLLKASRREIDHEKCSDFLDAVLSPGGKGEIAKWKT